MEEMGREKRRKCSASSAKEVDYEIRKDRAYHKGTGQTEKAHKAIRGSKGGCTAMGHVLPERATRAKNSYLER